MHKEERGIMMSYLQEMVNNTPSWVVQELRAISKDDDQLVMLLENFIERAGIMEFNGGLSRFQAEKQALLIVKKSI